MTERSQMMLVVKLRVLLLLFAPELLSKCDPSYRACAAELNRY